MKTIVKWTLIFTVTLIPVYTVSYATGYNDSIWYLYASYMIGYFVGMIYTIIRNNEDLPD